jgi:exopolysaccharide biosynthesis polyprenyl glycosylphosphotransferase
LTLETGTARGPASASDLPAPDRDVAEDIWWPVRHASLLVVADCVAIFLALVAAYLLKFDNQPGARLNGLSYVVLLILTGPVWLATLVVHRAYDPRIFGAGPAEFRRVAVASIRLFGLAAVVCYAFKLPLSRVFVGIAFGLGVALLMLGRWVARKLLHRQREAGRSSHRVLAIGDPEHVDDLARVLAREPYAGYAVVGACVPGQEIDETPGGIPSFGAPTGAVNAARIAHCDTIAVTASPGISAPSLRRLAWELEGSGVAMVVAPALTDVAGPRISIQPVAGLPLLHVDEPELGFLHRSVKRVMDIAIVTVAIVLLAPVYLVIALAVKISSRGPVIFRQTRIGRGEQEFLAYKFRSMHVDAEVRLAELQAHNEGAGVLFKMRDDPRVTRVGKVLRRYSLDELPQLFNVLRGDMSLVGPRPPLPTEVEEYESDVRRRLLVKPGVTGLWQVSGRSDLSWEDSVRLDLYYVENWSPVLDLVILLRTVLAVVRGAGAY